MVPRLTAELDFGAINNTAGGIKKTMEFGCVMVAWLINHVDIYTFMVKIAQTNITVQRGKLPMYTRYDISGYIHAVSV